MKENKGMVKIKFDKNWNSYSDNNQAYNNIEKSKAAHLIKNKIKNYKSQNIKKNKIIYILFLIILFILPYQKLINNYLNIYIVAHKDFKNELYNSYYKIICDNKTFFKNKYKIKIIEAYKNNELYPKKRGYCEGSKIFYIWKKYKQKKISSFYVGFAHYSRIFGFKNNIPNLDKIFSQYDVILNKRIRFPNNKNIKAQYSRFHFAKFLDEIEQIIKYNYSDYYSSAIKVFNNNNFMHCCNIFIMKKNDFIKYGDFVFGVLLEFDKRHNLKNDNDIRKLIKYEIKNLKKKKNLDYQCRLEGFLMERISSIFYQYKFKKIFEMKIKRNKR